MKKLFKILGMLILFTPGAFVLYIWAMLAYIAYWPIPPVPRQAIEYSIQDVAKAPENTTVRYYGKNPYFYGCNLANLNRLSLAMLNFREEAILTQHEERTHAFASKNAIPHQPLSSGDLMYGVADVNSLSHAIIRDKDWNWVLWRNGKTTMMRKGLSGYSWKPAALRFHKMNAQDEVIGNAYMGTGTASSGGFSDPHGRNTALLWRGDDNFASDLNSLIDIKSGWYLDQAIDINDSGQILCLARQTDEKGAEDYNNHDYHFVVLTPLK